MRRGFGETGRAGRLGGEEKAFFTEQILDGRVLRNEPKLMDAEGLVRTNPRCSGFSLVVRILRYEPNWLGPVLKKRIIYDRARTLQE